MSSGKQLATHDTDRSMHREVGVKRKPIRVYRCRDCGDFMEECDLRIAVNPFNKEETIIGCPACHAIDSTEIVCDIGTCRETAAHGIKSPLGYVWVCHGHKSAVTEEVKAQGAQK